MTEREEEALEELRELARETRCRAEDVCYGYFLGGDPRKFSPDHECSTEEEREAHRLACVAWDAGNKEPLPGPHEPLVADGQVIGHITRSGFGLGVNTVEDDVMLDIADRLERILDRLEQR